MRMISGENNIYFDLYIKLDDDGNPIEHPMLSGNILSAYIGIDLHTTTSFAPFIRREMRELGPWEKHVRTDYVKVPNSNCFTDSFVIEQMTEEEKLEKKKNTITKFNNDIGFKTWYFDDDLGEMVPPVPYPENYGKYTPEAPWSVYWDDEAVEWKNVPSVPDDAIVRGGIYRYVFDFYGREGNQYNWVRIGEYNKDRTEILFY